MEFTLDDVLIHYKIKCNKYKPEDLTDRLKDILYKEAVKEARFMNFINSGGVSTGF